MEKKSNPKNPAKSTNNHVLRKRLPPRVFQRQNDIYITNKTNFAAQIKKCEEILNSETGEVFLHSIGLAINRCINLALKLQQDSNGAYGVEANTSTIELVDDLHPLRDEDDFSTQNRKNSCLHVRIYRFSKNLTKSSVSNTK